MSLPDQTKYSKDQLLWEQMRSGDEQALADIFKQYYAMLYDYGMKFSNQPELVKDSIQEVFAYLWEKRETISKVNSVPAYLLVSMRRQLLKAVKRQQRIQDTYQEFNLNNSDNNFSVEDLLIMDEEIAAEKKLVKQAFDKIPTRMREALYLKTYSGLSYKEISLIMHINSQVARNYVSEAFRRLRLILTEASSIY